jgi:hypothetical protein
MSHKQLSITILSLCIVIGAIVFSEFTPAIPFESGSLRETSKVGLTRITGKATNECNCKGELCDEMGNEHCVWVGNLDPEKPCTGCEGPERLTARFGDEMVCYKGDTRNADAWFGCCADECKELGCPAPCEARYLRRAGVCNETYPSKCREIACYEIRTDI